MRFQQIEHALELLGQCGVPREDAVDVGRVAAGVQALVQAHPVGPVGLAVVVPLGVGTRGQAVHLGRGFAAAGLVKAAFLIAFFNVDPQVAVVVAVVHLGVGKVHQWLLVALAPDTRHAAQRQARNVFGVALAVVAARQQLVKAADEVKQMGVGVAVLGVKDRARDHGQPVAQA